MSMQCVEEFSTLPRTVFATFRAMLNMVGFSQYSFRYEHMIDLVHLIYVFFIAILLLNFLIAFMSNAVNEVEEHKEVLTNIQRLEMVTNMEGTTLCFPPLHRFLLKTRFKVVDDRLC